jgi:hypothetical protein
MNRNVAPTARVAVRARTTRSSRILVSIKDQPRDEDIGRYAGWGAGEDVDAPPGKGESEGPALAPFLRYRATDRAWRLAFGILWIPAVIVVITIEEWMGIPQNIQWISLGVVFLLFMAIGFLPQPRLR